jgi:deoxyribonuclease V
LVRVIRKLKERVDVILVNAHGVAHPEKCGCASHLGVTLDIPTIGVAGKVLCGTVSESDYGKIKYLKEGVEVIGAQLITQVGSKPIYVSVGHKVGLISAIEIVRRTVKENRMPEPLRLAHELSNEMRKRYSSTLSCQVTPDEGG